MDLEADGEPEFGRAFLRYQNKAWMSEGASKRQ